MSIGKLTADTLGVSSKSGVSAIATSSALAGGDLVINGISIGASRASDDTASTANQSASAIAKAAAVNRSSSQTGVSAIVDKTTASGSSMTAAITAGTVVLNGTTISVETTADATSSRAAVVAAIDAQSSLTGVTAVDNGQASLGVSLVASDGRNITTFFTGILTSASTGLSAAGTKTGGFTLVASSEVREIAVSGANLSNTGLVAGSFTSGVSTVSSTARTANAELAATAATAATAASVAGGVNVSSIAFDFSQGIQAEFATLTGTQGLSGTGTSFLVAQQASLTAGNIDLSTFANEFTSDGAIATLTGTVDIPAGLDFSTNNVSFRISTVEPIGATTNFDVQLVADYTGDNATMIIDINTALAGSGISAAMHGNNLEFTQDTGTTQTVIFTSQFDDADSGAAFGFAGANDTAEGVTETKLASFDVAINGGAATTVTLEGNYANSTGLLAAINSDLGATAVASLDATSGFLVIKSAATGVAAEIVTSNFTGTAVAQLGVQAGTANGTAAADTAFTLENGVAPAVTVTLNSDYTDATVGTGVGSGNTALPAAINAQVNTIGYNATLNVGNQLVITEQANGAGTVTFANGAGTPNAETLFGYAGAGLTGTGVAASGATNATFSVAVDGGGTQAININTIIANSTALLASINGQLAGALASLDDSGNLQIVSSTTGATSSIATSAIGGTTIAQLGLAAPASDTGTDIIAAILNKLEAGDLVINGVTIGAARAAADTASYAAASSSSKEASGIAIAAAINSSTASTGVSTSVNATVAKGTSAATAGSASNTGSMYVNGVAIGLTVQSSADSNRAFAVSQINAVSGQTGVAAEDNGTSVTLTAADGRNIVLALDKNGGSVSAANFGLAGAGISSSNFADGGSTGLTRANEGAVTTYSTVSLSSGGAINLAGGTNGNVALTDLGLSQGSFGGGIAGQFLTEVDISTQDGANKALTAVDNALNAVNSARADLGAIQNRFETTISNLAVTSENLSAANSRILDADFAVEAAALSRSQILQQAGISILAQANAAPQQVLSLLQ